LVKKKFKEKKKRKNSYDINKDEMLWSNDFVGEISTIRIGIYSYDNGEPKIRVTRFKEKKKKPGEIGFSRLGSMIISDAKIVKVGLGEAIKELERINSEKKGD
jgi:hypothetical protein